MPHFRFSAPAGGCLILTGVFVVRMHLYGQFVGGKNKLYQQGKILRGRAPFAPPFRRHVAPRFAEAHALERSASHFAANVGQPGFADRLSQILLLWKNRRKRTRSPDSGTERRLDAKRFRNHESGSGLSAGKESIEAPQPLLNPV